MNSPNRRKSSHTLFSILTIISIVVSSLLAATPPAQAAGFTAPALAHDHASHEHATGQEAGPVIVDFGGAPADAPVAGMEQWYADNGVGAAAAEADVLGTKKVVVLRVYFQDYANTSRYTKAQVEGMFGELDQLWRNTSYNKINIAYTVSDLFQLPDNRSSYIDDFDDGDLSNGGKYMKVLNDSIANAPAGLDWTNVDAVMVVMAETGAQFHRGQANKCTVAMGPGGDNKFVGCAIFSENPSETDRQVWGRWAHEMGHAFQQGGPAHPSNYNSEFELMDSNYPGQTGVFEKQESTGFPGWLPPAKYVVINPVSNEGGQFICLFAEEYDPAGVIHAQALKAKITDSLYYMISVRRRVLGDELNGGFASGIPDEGVLIERVSEGSDPWVTLKGKGGNRNNLWKRGDTFTSTGGGNPSDGISIFVNTVGTDPNEYCITIRYDKDANQPDMAMYPWTSPPADSWETTDIWIDSPINGFGSYRYGSWNDLSGNSVPRGNGDDPAVGMVNRLYARVRNWGTSPATNVVVNWEITDPMGVGIAGANGWASLGSVDQTTFPALASIAPGTFVDVYVDWTPNITLTPEQIAAGVFAFHTCLRVKINPVAGETALGNQDGDNEQENISYFEATNAGGGAPIYKNVIRLHNDDKANKKFFYLSYESDLPAAWSLDINGGNLGVELGPDEIVEIPVVIEPHGPAVIGSIFGVDVQAASQRNLVNDMDAKDIHLEFKPLGGVRVEARVLQPTQIDCKANDFGEIVVEGLLDNIAEFYNQRIPPRVLIQGYDEAQQLLGDGAGAVVPVAQDGKFTGTLFTQKGKITAVRCFFAGTDKLASSSTPFIPVLGSNETPVPPTTCTEMLSPTQIPSPGLINFDDLNDTNVIGAHYQPTYGVVFEDSATNQAIIYNQSLHPTEPTEAHSVPNVAMNKAVHPNTSAGVPMLLRFDSLKTHVGFYMGNGEVVGAAPLSGLLVAYDIAGNAICRVANQPVPEDVNEFIGLYDPAGRIAAITLDYGNTTIAEVIDDLYFAPHSGATPTPTTTPTPTPIVTPTPTPVNPVVAFPYLPVQKIVLAPFLNPDLAIHGIEITQGIQCFDPSNGLAGCADNAMPVALKKDTTARIYLKYSHPLFIGGSQNNVPVRLHIFANGVEYTANAQGRAKTFIDQAHSDSADIYFNVNFANDMPVTFYAEVDPNNVISESNESNNRFPASGTINLTFQKQDSLKVVGQRLRYHPAGYSGAQYAGGWAVNSGAADWFEQVLPMRNNGINYSVASGYLNWTGSLGSGAGQHDLIQYLNTVWVLQNAFGWLFGTTFANADHVYGWAPNDGYSGGHADMPVYPHAGGLGIVGIGTDRPGTSTDNPGGGALIFGHELTHDYNLLHTNTGDSCGSADSDSNFPYGSSSIQEYGFNPITGKIYNPATTHDLMSYCPAFGSKEGWIAPFTWMQMFNRLSPSVVSAAEAGATDATGAFRVTDAASSLVVNATIFNPEAPDFNPAVPGKLGALYQINTGVELALAAGGYAIELRNANSEVLASRTFSISFESEYSAHDGHDEPGHPEDLTQADVSFIMPWITGTTSVALVYAGLTLDSRSISANAPTVAVTNPATPAEWPAGSQQMLTWQGSDADGNALSYTVLFSKDGGTNWEVMATELTEATMEIDVDAMAGTTDGRFRIIATDGINIGQGDSAAVTIPNKAPIAAISDPISGKVFLPGALVVLQGSALDLEDGRLAEEQLHWASDLQGDLGTGASLPTNTLQAGEHTITLSVTDSQGVTATSSVKFWVGHQLFLPMVAK